MATTLDYDPASGQILLVTDHGTLSFDGCGPDLKIARQGENGEPERPLWLSPAEAMVMLKMVRYCLSLEKLSPTSRAVLEAVGPRLEPLTRTDEPAS